MLEGASCDNSEKSRKKDASWDLYYAWLYNYAFWSYPRSYQINATAMLPPEEIRAKGYQGRIILSALPPCVLSGRPFDGIAAWVAYAQDDYHESAVAASAARIEPTLAVVVSCLEDFEYASGCSQLVPQSISSVEEALHKKRQRCIKVTRHPMEDYSASLGDLGSLKRTIVTCATALREPGNYVVVHCKSGVGRSAQLVAALFVALGLSVEGACDYIAKQRPCVKLTRDRRAEIERVQTVLCETLEPKAVAMVLTVQQRDAKMPEATEPML